MTPGRGGETLISGLMTPSSGDDRVLGSGMKTSRVSLPLLPSKTTRPKNLPLGRAIRTRRRSTLAPTLVYMPISMVVKTVTTTAEKKMINSKGLTRQKEKLCAGEATRSATAWMINALRPEKKHLRNEETYIGQQHHYLLLESM